MPDISMCEGKDCPIKEKCYRFKATPSRYGQSYFMESPYKDGKCDELIDIRKDHKITIRSEDMSKK